MALDFALIHFGQNEEQRGHGQGAQNGTEDEENCAQGIVQFPLHCATNQLLHFLKCKSIKFKSRII
jgi:hypothetical protein